MGGPRTAVYVRFLAVFAVLGTLGIAGTVYVLIKQRAPVPFRDTYAVHVELAAANGVVEGIGQPVNVAGVKVGQVTGVRLAQGRAVLTLRIERDQLPRVYGDATAALEPITPLADMQLSLNPGAPPARPLPDGETVTLAATSVPVPLSDVLASLDGDTRTFLAGMIAELDRGAGRRGPDLRRLFTALGPTTAQIGAISRALARQRRAVARLVHNLGAVAHAASRDERLASVVHAGNATLDALARQEGPLREAVAELPATLDATRATLVELAPFSRALRPAVRALEPGVARLPAAFEAVVPFTAAGTPALRDHIRPFVREATPAVRRLAPAVPDLAAATGDLSQTFQVLRYALNELAYNPPGDDEGFLFWFSWFAHNANSVLSMGDANGGIGRSAPLVDCSGLQAVKELRQAFDLAGLCPA